MSIKLCFTAKICRKQLGKNCYQTHFLPYGVFLGVGAGVLYVPVPVPGVLYVPDVPGVGVGETLVWGLFLLLGGLAVVVGVGVAVVADLGVAVVVGFGVAVVVGFGVCA